MPSKYYPLNPNFRGLGAFLRGEEMQAHLRERAEKIKAAAEADAPVGDPTDPWYLKEGHPPAGTYKASFEVESGVAVNANGDRVAYAKAKNTAPHAAAVEYGFGGRSKEDGPSAHHTLTRAIDAARET